MFVDSISNIEIATTTRELLLGESPEVFEVLGYDAEGIYNCWTIKEYTLIFYNILHPIKAFFTLLFLFSKQKVCISNISFI